MNIDEVFEGMIWNGDWALSGIPSCIRDEDKKWYVAYMDDESCPQLSVYDKNLFEENLKKEIQIQNEAVDEGFCEEKIERYEGIFSNKIDTIDLEVEVLRCSEV